MNERRFGLLLVFIIAGVGAIGLLGSGITGNATTAMRGFMDDSSLYDRWSENCDTLVEKYNALCGEVISGSGVQKAKDPARCTMLKNQMVKACDAKEKYALRAGVGENAPPRGTVLRYVLPTGGATVVDVIDSEADSVAGSGTIAGIPLSLAVVVGIGVLFLYFRRRQTR